MKVMWCKKRIIITNITAESFNIKLNGCALTFVFCADCETNNFKFLFPLENGGKRFIDVKKVHFGIPKERF